MKPRTEPADELLPITPPTAKCCGTCAHFRMVARSFGTCHAAAPAFDAIRAGLPESIQRVGMNTFMGGSCCCWAVRSGAVVPVAVDYRGVDPVPRRGVPAVNRQGRLL